MKLHVSDTNNQKSVAVDISVSLLNFNKRSSFMLFEADFQYYQVIEPVKLSAGRTTLSTDVPSW